MWAKILLTLVMGGMPPFTSEKFINYYIFTIIMKSVAIIKLKIPQRNELIETMRRYSQSAQKVIDFEQIENIAS